MGDSEGGCMNGAWDPSVHDTFFIRQHFLFPYNLQ